MRPLMSRRNHEGAGDDDGDGVDEARVCDGDIQLRNNVGQQQVHNAHVDDH